MTEESIELNRRFRALIENFIKQNNLSCNSCSKSVNGKCTAKVYCNIRDHNYFLAYERKVAEKQSMTEKQKSCIDWIEEMTGAVYEGGSVSEFINEHIEEARFQSQLLAEANAPNG